MAVTRDVYVTVEIRQLIRLPSIPPALVFHLHFQTLRSILLPNDPFHAAHNMFSLSPDQTHFHNNSDVLLCFATH